MHLVGYLYEEDHTLRSVTSYAIPLCYEVTSEVHGKALPINTQNCGDLDIKGTCQALYVINTQKQRKIRSSCLFARISCNTQQISIKSGAAGRGVPLRARHFSPWLTQSSNRNYIKEYQRSVT
jgi:hypothetical protein